MNSALSKFLFFYPVTLSKGEPIAFLIGDYRRNQWLPLQKIQELQLKLFKEIMQHSIANSVFYRELYRKHGVSVNDIQTLDDIKSLPIVSKDDLIQSLDIISTKNKNFFASTKTTGGSTGQPVKLFKDALALARERCATSRAYEWAGIGLGDSQLRFWGVPHSKNARRMAHLTDIIANRKRVSAFNLTDDSLASYYDESKVYKPKYVYGYVSVIERFARFIVDNNLDPLPSVKAVITTAEVLNSNARSVIESAFQVNVYNEYGCGEVGSIAHQCEVGNMHIMADNLYVEVDGTDSGEIIVTDFFNRATPLIRYRLGDFATLSSAICPCGRGFPIIDAIHGRAYDLLEMPSGKKMHPESVIYVFEQIQQETNAFKQFQVIQHSVNTIEAKIIANVNWSEAVSNRLISELKKHIDRSVHFSVTQVDTLPREKSGKMRLVKRNF
ncbi:phenylacetate--CoA ligase family protein [Marinobacter salicampi]|uniref:phenylacetate--CoA ligase family protein n=1 Tax=Marinobacter salicampi TaxID=435907 RepID=UPI00140D43C6|nr:phenylacetate--CoA ligase family protein [Marinobacter salicampi]